MKHKQSLRVISLCLILIGSALVEVSSSSIESSSSIQGGIKQGQTSQSAPADKEVAIVDDTGDLYTGVLDDYKGGTYSGMVKELGAIPMENMWVIGRMELFMVRASLRRMLEENTLGNGKMVILGTETYTTKMG